MLNKIIATVVKNLFCEHLVYGDGEESYLFEIGGVSIEVFSDRTVHIKGLNRLVLEYQYFFFGRESGKTKEEIYLDAMKAIAESEQAMEDYKREQEAKLRKNFPFLESDYAIPDYRLSETGLLELIGGSKCQCEPSIVQKTFWIGINKVSLEC